MPCVLAECESLYGAHDIPFFTLQCAVVNGKKQMRPPKNWQSAEQSELKFYNKNACCIRTGYLATNCSLVVVDADGADAIVVVDELVRRTCRGLVVPMVQTQRGANGRHYYFPRDANDEPQERREARHRRHPDERRCACRRQR